MLFKKMCNTPIFLLHGLGSHPVTLYPLERYLNQKGYTNTYSISYNPDRSDIELSVLEVDRKMLLKADKLNEEIILIGQSMGGVVANHLHKEGWKIKKAIYIGSPLHGAKMTSIVENWVPNFLLNWFKSPAWESLSEKSKQFQETEDKKTFVEKFEPPHDYHTISMGWWNTEWDSRVFKDETMFNPDKHTHLDREDHCLIFMKPRLWELVHKLIDDICNVDS